MVQTSRPSRFFLTAFFLCDGSVRCDASAVRRPNPSRSNDARMIQQVVCQAAGTLGDSESCAGRERKSDTGQRLTGDKSGDMAADLPDACFEAILESNRGAVLSALKGVATTPIRLFSFLLK